MQSTAPRIARNPAFRCTRFVLLALAVTFASADAAHAWQRVRVNVSVQMSVSSEQVPQPSHPWWMYFPYDPHLAAPPTASRYPHWPASLPANQAAQPAPSPNVVWQPGTAQPGAGQPAFALPGVPGRLTSFQPGAAPFSFDR
jgi:hypothetical protein